MELIEIDIDQILILGIERFYLVHSDEVIQCAKIENGVLYYYDTEEDEWVDWSPYDREPIPTLIRGFRGTAPFKLYIMNKE